MERKIAVSVFVSSEKTQEKTQESHGIVPITPLLPVVSLLPMLYSNSPSAVWDVILIHLIPVSSPSPTCIQSLPAKIGKISRGRRVTFSLGETVDYRINKFTRQFSPVGNHTSLRTSKASDYIRSSMAHNATWLEAVRLIKLSQLCPVLV